tara:strand:+ start:34 stop:567 length:534 start_codon:yes stop_codon:yes gene_type:complete
MSQIKVNSIVPKDGLPSGASGGIIQVKQVIKTNVASFNGSTSNFSGNISGLTETITTQSNSSKVLIFLHTNYSTSSGQRGTFRILRGSTVLSVGDSNGSVNRGLFPSVAPADNDSRCVPCSMLIVDTPGSAGTHTYNVQGQAESSAGTVYINRTKGNNDSNTYHSGISTLTLMELGA